MAGIQLNTGKTRCWNQNGRFPPDIFDRARSTSANFDFGQFVFSSSANSTSANFDFGQFNFANFWVVLVRPILGFRFRPIFAKWRKLEAGARRVGARRVGAQNFAFCFSLPSEFHSFSSLWGVFSLNFGGVFVAPDLQKHHQNSTRRHPRERRKNEISGGRKEKRAKFWAVQRRAVPGKAVHIETQTRENKGPKAVWFWTFFCCGSSIFGARQGGTPTKAENTEKQENETSTHTP